MKNVCLFGYGVWGKKVYSTLKQIKSINSIQIIKNRRDKKKIDLNKLDWILITTNTNTHYNIAKKYLNMGIDVFCEKPLTNNIKKDLKLYKIAKKNKCKLYVSDVENYKKKT